VLVRRAVGLKSVARAVRRCGPEHRNRGSDAARKRVRLRDTRRRHAGPELVSGRRENVQVVKTENSVPIVFSTVPRTKTKMAIRRFTRERLFFFVLFSKLFSNLRFAYGSRIAVMTPHGQTRTANPPFIACRP